jgi:Mg2+-importing ATPase
MRLLMRQFQSPLVLILLVGSAISLALREWIDAAIILIIVLGSTLIGFAQEYRARSAIAGLQRRLSLICRVLRDGVERSVPAATVVPGDIVLLSAGNMVPADSLILEAKDFLVAEASLTGESLPVEKRPGLVPVTAALSQRSNCVFHGTSVRSGTAQVLAVLTGARTVYGAIADRLAAPEMETEFSRGLREFGYLLIRVMIVTVLFVLTINWLLDRPVIESLLFAVALSVGLSPELLPAIVSVMLSNGARRLAHRGVIVRHLEAIENLGSVTVLCTDKTGTLTEGLVALHDACDPNGRPSNDVRKLAFINATFETGIDNPLDAAIILFGQRDGLTCEGIQKIDEIPFDFRRKRLTIVVEKSVNPKRHLIVTKGAFANVLGICETVTEDGAVVPLDDVHREKLDLFYREKSKAGFRVLALATSEVGAKARYEIADEAALTFAGFLLFLDPPKPDAYGAIANLAKLGIGIKIITGDNRYVAAHVADMVGLDSKVMITGEELVSLRDEALFYLAPRTTLFVEVDPQQKERIVRALQRAGHAVGYLGDGINDAPALHAADIGISVDQAVDVARESADIVLLKPDLDVLREGVEEGRRTFSNTLKYICITISANFGNMISMALAVPVLPFFPLAATQILLNNFLSDLPAMAISTDRISTDQIEHPQRWRIADVRRFMLVFGFISSLFDLITFATVFMVTEADRATFQTIWFVVSLLTELAVVLILRSREPILRATPPSSLLLWTTVAMSVAALAIPFLDPISALFGFVPLSLSELGWVILIVGGYAIATEAAKRHFL